VAVVSTYLNTPAWQSFCKFFLVYPVE
jgi:hypothetical protein